jgi:hypothetical protein
MRERATADTAADWTAFDESVVFPCYFKDLKHPRQQGKKDCPLLEILLPACSPSLPGGGTITDAALFGRKKLFRSAAPLSPVRQ